jgi:hypothetical protein
VLHYLGPDSSTTLLSFPAGDDAGIVAIRRGRVAALLTLTVRDGLVHHLDAVVQRAKLAPVAAALGL